MENFIIEPGENFGNGSSGSLLNGGLLQVNVQAEENKWRKMVEPQQPHCEVNLKPVLEMTYNTAKDGGLQLLQYLEQAPSEAEMEFKVEQDSLLNAFRDGSLELESVFNELSESTKFKPRVSVSLYVVKDAVRLMSEERERLKRVLAKLARLLNCGGHSINFSDGVQTYSEGFEKVHEALIHWCIPELTEFLGGAIEDHCTSGETCGDGNASEIEELTQEQGNSHPATEQTDFVLPETGEFCEDLAGAKNCFIDSVEVPCSSKNNETMESAYEEILNKRTRRAGLRDIVICGQRIAQVPKLPRVNKNGIRSKLRTRFKSSKDLQGPSSVPCDDKGLSSSENCQDVGIPVPNYRSRRSMPVQQYIHADLNERTLYQCDLCSAPGFITSSSRNKHYRTVHRYLQNPSVVISEMRMLPDVMLHRVQSNQNCGAHKDSENPCCNLRVLFLNERNFFLCPKQYQD